MKKANNPIHCALSLVGEPIMYPHINEFVDYLHDKGISTYLVTNAQFPDAIATLPPITQVNHANLRQCYRLFSDTLPINV